MTKILLVGSNGQLGLELKRALSSLGEVWEADRKSADLSEASAIVALVKETTPDIIVNAAAYTAVERAETEPHLAYLVNARGPEILAREASRLGALLLHYSTDYVFDGKKEGPYDENDAPCPLSIYGKTKSAGDEAIRRENPRHVIIRTSWLYGLGGSNFLTTMLRLMGEREHLAVVDDQIGAPTCTRLIARVSNQIIQRYVGKRAAPFPFGIFNVAATGTTSWHGYARFIAAEALKLGYTLKIRPDDIHAVPASSYPSAASRPNNSVLDIRKICRTFGIDLPEWRPDVVEVLRLIKQTEGI